MRLSVNALCVDYPSQIAFGKNVERIADGIVIAVVEAVFQFLAGVIFSTEITRAISFMSRPGGFSQNT